MCRFKSGIILKNRCVIAQENDSHSNLLEGLAIEDSQENAMRRFVRAELLPPNNEWWREPDESWKFNVDQDILPDWFTEDSGKYEADFREAVKEWWKEHIIVDKKIDELSSGYYRLKRCEVKKLLKDVQVMCDSSTVQVMCGSSTVQEMYGSSIARNYYKGTIEISIECNLKVNIHKNKDNKS